jgi:hypothetical protein
MVVEAFFGFLGVAVRRSNCEIANIMIPLLGFWIAATVAL